MKRPLLLSILLLFFTTSYSQIKGSKTDLKIGQVKVLYSKILKEDRRLNIFLPQKYDPAKAYPVIYALDGSMHEDFIHLCGLVQFFQLQFKMPDFIIVGISNVDRKRDFTHHTEMAEMKEAIPTSGHSKEFMQFIEKELQPFVEKNYKTDGTRYLIGQSLGGLLATEILLKHADLFTHYFIVSPSLWWDDQSMINQAETLFANQKHGKLFVYISVGKGEHPIMRRDAKKLNKTLKNIGKNNVELHFNLMKKENHATILHNSIYEGLWHLYPYQEPE